MNKLDNKLILDRQFTLELLDCLDVNDPDHGQVAQKLHEIMSAQDNTGWATVVIEPSDDHVHEAWLKNDDDLEHKVLRNAYTVMLNASPPLPGGGE
jgi:hypothetical protein